MARLVPVLNLLSVVIVIFALAMLLPLQVSIIYGDAARDAYEVAVLVTFASGAVLWTATRAGRAELQPRDGFLLVALVWTVLPTFATVPLLSHASDLSFTDAYFETVAALTTTGSTGCRRRSISGAASFNGWAAWASSFLRWRSCRCSASAAARS